jgi:hypothetical protein
MTSGQLTAGGRRRGRAQRWSRAKDFERGEVLYELSRCLEVLGEGQGSREALEELRRLGPRRG